MRASVVFFLVGREIISLSVKVQEQAHKLLVILNAMSHRNSLSHICAQKGEMLNANRLPYIESCIIYIVIVFPNYMYNRTFICSTLFIFNSFLYNLLLEFYSLSSCKMNNFPFLFASFLHLSIYMYVYCIYAIIFTCISSSFSFCLLFYNTYVPFLKGR